MKISTIQRSLAAVLFAGLSVISASAQQTEYTDGVFMLNEGSYGKETATVNFLDHSGKWQYRIGSNADASAMTLGTTGCYATISGERMYIVCKKMSLADKEAFDPTLTVCDARTMEVIKQINIITDAEGYIVDGRSFLAIPDQDKGYLSTTGGVYVISLSDLSVKGVIKGTDGLTNNQTGGMIYRDGKVYAAGCILPLTDDQQISRELGTRHRAGVGMSENSDAVVVIVSEETGTVSIAEGGELTRNYSHETLVKALEDRILWNQQEAKKPIWRRKKGEKA